MTREKSLRYLIHVMISDGEEILRLDICKNNLIRKEDLSADYDVQHIDGKRY